MLKREIIIDTLDKKRSYNAMMKETKKINNDNTLINGNITLLIILTLENETLSCKIRKIDNIKEKSTDYDFSKLNDSTNSTKDNFSKGFSELKKEINELKSTNIKKSLNLSINQRFNTDNYVVDFVFDDNPSDCVNKSTIKPNISDTNTVSQNDLKKLDVHSLSDKLKLNEKKKDNKMAFDNSKINDFLHSRHSDLRDENLVSKNETNITNKINLNKNNINFTNNPFFNLQNSFLNKKK